VQDNFRENPVLRLLAIAFALFTAVGVAQAQPAAGVEYRELSAPQAVETPGKIEVVEFFWYGCPHCYNFEPLLEPWVSKLPKDVQFRRIPAIFNDEWAHGARAYYALEALGEIPRLHKPLFDAVHQGSRIRVGDEAAITEWVGKQGVDTKKFTAAYHSFSVDSKVKRAAQLTQAYRIEGVPSMAVNGKYVVVTDNMKSFTQILSVSDYLIEQARKQSAKTATK